MVSLHKEAFFTLIVLFFCVYNVSAKAKIPIGKINQFEIVAELPDTEEYTPEEGSEEYLDLARMHEEFNIAWILPIWVTKEPKLVLMKKDSEEYYELTDEQLEKVLKANNLNKDELLQLGLYTRYGGKAIILLLVALIVYSFLPTKKKKEDDVEPTNI